MIGGIFIQWGRRKKQVNYNRLLDLWFIPDDQDVSNFVDDHDTTSISALTANELLLFSTDRMHCCPV